MLKSIKRTIGSGGEKYDATIGFDGMTIEQIQQDAMSFYVWRLQRQIREADEATRTEFALNGIEVHAKDVGKTIVSTSELVDKMSDEQAMQAFELLKEKLGE